MSQKKKKKEKIHKKRREEKKKRFAYLQKLKIIDRKRVTGRYFF